MKTTLVNTHLATTHFQTFIDAFAALDQRSRELAGDYVLCPPSEDYGYQSTPKNAVTFAVMGVDGVHYAVLKLDGQVRDDSPVVHVSPMDATDVTIMAESFLFFLAEGCGVATGKMQAVFDAERSGMNQLVTFLSEHFERPQFPKDEQRRKFTVRFGHLIERKAG